MARIFISHSSQDREAADGIKQWLDAQGFSNLFLDFDKHAGILPGADWERTLYREIARSHAVILIVTAHWNVSRWCWSEFTQARALGKPIFPVIESPSAEMPTAPDIQSIDLRTDREGGLERLARALESIARQQHEFTWDNTRPPYPGLLAFQEEDAAIYFGRDDDIRRLMERLNARRTVGGAKFVALLGASGSGKSSLLRAGLIPRLKRDKRSWIVLPPFRPRIRPIEEFASALAIAVGGQHNWRGFNDLLRSEAAAATLQDVGRDLRSRAGELDAQILIPIDQAEELFGVALSEEADLFLELLNVVLGETMPYLAVAAMRSDHLGSLQQAGALLVPFEEFSIKPLPLARIPEIIGGPARIAGLTVDDALVVRAMQDASTEDALPLLAFALRELYERFAAEDKRLSLDDYQRLGDLHLQLSPLENAVRQSADDVLRRAEPSQGELSALREAFVPAMVRVNEDGEYVRRPARWLDLPPRAHRLLECLAQARLLVIGGERNERTIEVAHEALLRKWPQLRSWVDAEREFLIGKTQIERSLEDWQLADPTTKPHALLYGLQLSRAKNWLAEHPTGFNERERRYIQLSIDEESRFFRKTRRERAFALGSLLILALVSVLVGPWAFGVIKERQLVEREAARTDIRGEIVAYATAVGGTALDSAEGHDTSPYTTPLVEHLRQKNKNLLQALTDAHQHVTRLSNGTQRPFLSTNMNGPIFLWRQPVTRTKRAIVISAGDIGLAEDKLLAPKHDADAVVSLLRQAGYLDSEIVSLNNPDKSEIERTVQTTLHTLQHPQNNTQAARKPPSDAQALGADPESPRPMAPPTEPAANTLVLFYYSGHGVSLSGKNYLAPKLTNPYFRDELRFQSQLFSLDSLLHSLGSRVTASVIILDTHFPTLSADAFNR